MYFSPSCPQLPASGSSFDQDSAVAFHVSSVEADCLLPSHDCCSSADSEDHLLLFFPAEFLAGPFLSFR